MVENYTGVCLVPSTFEVTYKRVKVSQRLPYWPVTEVIKDGGADYSEFEVIGDYENLTFEYKSEYSSTVATEAVLECARSLYEGQPTSWKKLAGSFAKRGFIR